ncbi:MAG: peptidylprolyl isomerase [Phycisphaerae bacterium]|nr:peptidylprolyl isomerase [Phycisphaerae bacterium]
MKILLSILLLGFVFLVSAGCDSQADVSKNDQTTKPAPDKTDTIPANTVTPEPVNPVAVTPVTPKPVEPVKIDPTKVIAKVNDLEILEADILANTKEMEEAQFAQRKMPEEQLAGWRKNVRPQIIDMLINSKLIEIEAKNSNVTITEKDIADALEENVQNVLTSRSWTREDFDKEIQESMKMTLAEYLEKTKSNPSFKEYLTMEKLLSLKYADDLKVTDKEVNDFYTENLDKYFKQDEQVKASHILFSTMDMETRKPLSDKEKEEAKTKADQVLKEVKAPEADFAALAKKYSSCPSSAQGGDLGFFPRTGKMVEPFAKAAFETEVGQITDIVETQFGYHIIKVTEKKEASTTPFDEVKDKISGSLKNNKKNESTKKFYQDLKAKADIVNYEKPEDSPLEMDSN